MELQPSSAHPEPRSDDESCSLGPAAEIALPQESTFTTVDCGDRWQMYFRLQELGIPCQCKSYQPLQVDIQSAQALVQIWSIAKRIATPRADLAQWLNQCLRLPSPQIDC